MAQCPDRRSTGKPGPARCGMKQVCVLGNGQLGRMLRQAGEPL
ncbi:5-(carboxyamino)imidazole ribonucleotide synthase, partial [Escherichia coli]